MKYMTKQWYQTMQDTGLNVCLETDKRAAEFSEAYFRECWNSGVSDWLETRREVCEVLETPFDERSERRLYARNYRDWLHRLQARVPPHIMAQVADVRVLALYRCTAQVKAELDAYSEECRRRTRQVMVDYDAFEKEQGIDAPWVKEFSFHDEQVVSCRKAGADRIIDFGPVEDGYCQVEKIIFRNARVLCRDKPLHGAFWLYEEVYKTLAGYEVHVLLYKKGLVEVIIECDDVELVKGN